MEADAYWYENALVTEYERQVPILATYRSQTAPIQRHSNGKQAFVFVLWISTYVEYQKYH